MVVKHWKDLDRPSKKVEKKLTEKKMDWGPLTSFFQSFQLQLAVVTSGSSLLCCHGDGSSDIMRSTVNTEHVITYGCAVYDGGKDGENYTLKLQLQLIITFIINYSAGKGWNIWRHKMVKMMWCLQIACFKRGCKSLTFQLIKSRLWTMLTKSF